MSSEFQIIFTSVITLLAGLALFILRGVYKKFELLEEIVREIQEKYTSASERLVKLETIANLHTMEQMRDFGRLSSMEQLKQLDKMRKDRLDDNE